VVGRLAARFRVKAGLVEDDSRLPLKKKLIDNRRFKLFLISILKIESLRLSMSLPRALITHPAFLLEQSSGLLYSVPPDPAINLLNK